MVNKVILLGNLGRDPELKNTNSGTSIAELSVATSMKWKDKNGTMQERTEWHRVVTFGRTAEAAAQYLAKGSKVYVEGRLQTDQYEKNGEKRYSTKIIAESLKFLSGKKDGGEREESEPRTSQGDVPFGNDDIPF